MLRLRTLLALAAPLPAAFLVPVPCLHAQPAPDPVTVAPDALAGLEEQAAETADPESFAVLLEQLAGAPLDLNTATAEALAQVPAVSPQLARRIVRRRARNGAFRSVDGLREVEGMTEDDLASLRPFVTVAGVVPARRRLRVEVLQRVARRTASEAGAAPYPGSPDRVLTRLRARHGDRLALHLTLDKDAGEPFAWAPGRGSYGFDFASASLALRGAGRLERLVVGDFVVAFGQGVALWRGSGFGKGRDAVRGVGRTAAGLTPYGSSDETRFFRGAAATIRVAPSVSASAFASRRRLDAGLVADSLAGTVAASLPATGLHRTDLERSRKAVLGHDLAGGTLVFAHGGLRLGAAGYVARFEHPVRRGPAPYERFEFDGTHTAVASISVDATTGGYHAFGEATLGHGGVPGGVAGLAVAGGRAAEVVLHVRRFPADFVSLHGDSFGEYGGAPQNETGVYVGLRLVPARGWRLDAFFDQYRAPWLRFGVPRPSRGREALLSVEHAPRAWLRWHALVRTETREEPVTVAGAGGHPLTAVAPHTRQSARLHGDYAFSRRLHLQARLEGVRYTAPGHTAAHGVLLYQDVRWQTAAFLRVDARLTFFDTDGFDARLYAYEDDLRYAFSVPAWSGRGQHAYLLLHVAPRPGLLLQVKYGVTRYDDAAGAPPRRQLAAQVMATF